MSALVVNCKGRKIGSAIESEIKLRDLSSGQTFKVEETYFHFGFSLHIIAIAMEKGKFWRKCKFDCNCCQFLNIWKKVITQIDGIVFLGFFYVLLVFLHTNSKNYFIWNICLFKTSSDRRFGWSLCRKPLEGDQFHAIWSLWSISSWTLSQIPTIDTENHFHCYHKYQQLKTRGKSFLWPFRDSGASSSGFPSERPGPS